jgi:hypothetical protein
MNIEVMTIDTEASTPQRRRSDSGNSLICSVFQDIHCPKCDCYMKYGFHSITCENPNCEIFGRHFKKPTIELEAY